jgi:hypothetical protein
VGYHGNRQDKGRFRNVYPQCPLRESENYIGSCHVFRSSKYLNNAKHISSHMGLILENSRDELRSSFATKYKMPASARPASVDAVRVFGGTGRI